MCDNQNTVPVFFSCDDNYVPFLAVAIHSLIQHLGDDTTCKIHILNNGIEASHLQTLLGMATDRVSICSVDVSREIAPLLEKLNLRDYYTPSIYFRLFIPSLFPQYHKAIYLDADVVLTRDIRELYETPLGNCLAGAVSDDIIAGRQVYHDYTEQGLGIPYREYFNSGVLLMNLDQFRIQKIEHRFIYLLNTYHFDTICPDQDYLNVLCHGHVQFLDKGWNKMSLNEDYDGTPALIHYNMFYKPWQYDHICYDSYFWDAAKETPFYEDICRIRKSFGWRDRMGHRKANRVLERSAARISRQSNNFRSVLADLPVEKQLEWTNEHEA